MNSSRFAFISCVLVVAGMLVFASTGLSNWMWELADYFFPPETVKRQVLGFIPVSGVRENPMNEQAYQWLNVIYWVIFAVFSLAALVFAQRALKGSLPNQTSDANSDQTCARTHVPLAHSVGRHRRDVVRNLQRVTKKLSQVDMTGFASLLTRQERYKIEGLIKRGGMGAVYLGFDSDLERPVAIKVFEADQGVDKAALLRFEQEAKSLAQLRHPHIVQVLDMIREPGRVAFVMELFEGGDLDDLLREHAEVPLSREQSLAIIEALLEALSYAHSQGVIHRDIKPANILFERHSGQAAELKLIDFGIAKAESCEFSTQVGLSLGSPSYMSPEQAQGKAVDVRSDIYSVGLLLYRLLVNEPAFSGDYQAVLNQQIAVEVNLAQWRHVLGEELSALIEKSTAKVARGRFQSAEQMLEALRAISKTGKTT